VPGDEEPSEGHGWAPYEPHRSPSPEPGTDVTTGPTTRPSGSGGGGVVATAVALVVLLLVGVGAAVSALGGGDSDTDTASETTSAPVQPAPEGGNAPVAVDEPAPGVLTRDGLAALVDAVAEATGGTEVFRAVLYPEYASVAVPEDRTTARQRMLSWNGRELSDNDFLGRSSYARVDLAAIDAGALTRLLRRVAVRVEDPTSRYVIVEGASTIFDEPDRILAYATNEYSEGAYVVADLDGKVVRVVDF
jgi:eukaryotic-like serine/threonine-protein kinase